MANVDVLVVGAGPNGLSAAIAAARAGCSVLVLEAQSTAGGGARTESLTLPGFLHDFGSAVHPFAALSPFFRTLPLERFGLTWVQPEIALAHPLPDKTAAVLLRSMDETAAGLGVDAASYARHMRAPLETLAWVIDELPHGRLPRHPASVLRWAAASLLPASAIARRWFESTTARALIAGLAAHSALPLDWRGTGALALALAAAAHMVGWPFPRGGAQQITSALLACLCDAWRRGANRLPGTLACGPASGKNSFLGSHAATTAEHSRRCRSSLVSAGSGALPLWPWRLQSGLGIVRPHTVARRRLPKSGHNPSGWKLRGDCAQRSRGLARHASAPAIRPVIAAQSLRSDSRSAGTAHRLGILSRSQRMRHLHGRCD